MVYSYTPIYYTSIQDSITSLCKNILPFSLKKKRLPAIAAAEQKLSKQQADNLKWQQESFHQILKLMGLCNEDLITEQEVSDFRTYLLDSLIASPFDHEHSEILKDKLVFLQELLYSKCISEMEYHAFKRPLLQRLAVQGAEIEARDVIVEDRKKKSDEEWSAIDLKDDKCLLKKESPNVKNKSKMKGVASVLGFGSSSSAQKKGKSKEAESGQENSGKKQMEFLTENPFWDNTQLSEKQSETKSILMPESFPPVETRKVEVRKPFKTLFQTDHKKERQSDNGFNPEENTIKSGKMQWGFDGFKKLKKFDEPKTNTKQSDSFVDTKVVVGQKVNKELEYIEAELRPKNTSIHHSSLSIDQQQQFGKKADSANETNSKWTTFEDDNDYENCQPKTYHGKNPFAASTDFQQSTEKKGVNPFFRA